MMNKEDNISLALLISIGALAIFAELNKSFINWFINYLRSLPDTLLLVSLLIVCIVLIFIIHCLHAVFEYIEEKIRTCLTRRNNDDQKY